MAAHLQYWPPPEGTAAHSPLTQSAAWQTAVVQYGPAQPNAQSQPRVVVHTPWPEQETPSFKHNTASTRGTTQPVRTHTRRHERTATTHRPGERAPSALATHTSA